MTGREVMFVLQVTEEKPSHVPEFAEIRAKVEMAYRTARAREEAQAAAAKLLAASADLSALHTAAKADGWKIETTGFFNRMDAADPQKMVASFPGQLLDFARDSYRVTTGTVRLSDNAGYSEDSVTGYVVWGVKESQGSQPRGVQEGSRAARGGLRHRATGNGPQRVARG